MLLHFFIDSLSPIGENYLNPDSTVLDAYFNWVSRSVLDCSLDSVLDNIGKGFGKKVSVSKDKASGIKTLHIYRVRREGFPDSLKRKVQDLLDFHRIELDGINLDCLIKLIQATHQAIIYRLQLLHFLVLGIVLSDFFQKNPGG